MKTHGAYLYMTAILLTVPCRLAAQTYDGGDTTYSISGYLEDYGATEVRVGSTTPNNTLTISKQGVLKNGAATIGHAAAADSNKVVVVEPNSKWLSAGALYIGYFGSDNELKLQAGATVSNGLCHLGWDDLSSGNRVVVEGGSVWSNTGIYVGRWGDGNSLTILDGGRVESSGGGTTHIGWESYAANNRILVSGSGSEWNSVGGVVVGNEGDYNSLTISNGAHVVGNSGAIGSDSVAYGNEATVTGTGSQWMVSLSLQVGSSGDNGALTIANGGYVESITGFLGNQTGSSGNSALVTGAGSQWTITGGGASYLYVGYYGHNSSMTIDAGGRVEGMAGIIGNFAPAVNGSMTVTGVDSVWHNEDFMVVGNGSTNNELRIENGGLVRDWDGTISAFGATRNNRVYVSGSGSVWTNAYSLYVGSNGSEALLSIESGGHVYTRYGCIGLASTANSNVVTLADTGSELNASISLKVGAPGNVGNTLSIAGGCVWTPALTIESNNTVTLQAGGTVHVGGDFDAAPAGDFNFPGGLLIVDGTVSNLPTVKSIGSLQTASIVGDLLLYGTFIVGDGVAEAQLNGAMTMRAGSVLDMEINGYSPGSEHDRLSVSGETVRAGALTVGFGGAFSPTNWSSFHLFNWGESSEGMFDGFDLPTLDDGLRWDTSRIYDLGTLRVVFDDPDGDGDNDGMPDVWEFDYFNGNAEPDGNPDDDPLTNLDEYIAGMNPTNAQSYFRITNQRHDTNSAGHILEWNAATGRLYEVFWSDVLTNGFQSIQSNLLYSQNVFTDTVHTADSEGYYHVKVRYP